MSRVWVIYTVFCLAAAVLGAVKVGLWFGAFVVGQSVVQMIPAWWLSRS